MKNSKKIILDLCGGTGAWSEPYKKAGYDVRLITLPDFDVKENWLFRDSKKICFLNLLNRKIMEVAMKNVYGILAAPPCTEFSKACFNKKKKDRDFSTGFEVVRACLEIIWIIQEKGAPLKFWALENPMGYLNRFLGHPAFYFQPWQFGETDFRRTKRTYLWGYFNPPAKTFLKRDFPFITQYTPRRKNKSKFPLFPKYQPEKQRGNKDWGKVRAEERAKTSAYFAKAFFKANQ